MKLLKQPMIIWYILAGTLISIFVPTLLQENHAIETFAHIGISFLLFIVGLELNLKIIKDVWKSSIIAWILQVVLSALIGYWLGVLLGFEWLTAIYLWIGCAFSSTIVILKLLSDKWNTHSVYWRLSIWILIVQDLIVMLLFLAISTIEQLSTWGWLMVGGMLLAKIIWLGLWIYIIWKYILPIATKKIAESQEHLFLFSIWRCLILGSIFYLLWFSIEIWALVAGITLASSDYKFEIMSKVKPLRDFFVVLFFVLLGSRIKFPIPGEYFLPIVVFTLFILVIKPLIITIILSKIWHTKKNNILTWLSLGQISEFSFILIMMWIAHGHIQDEWLLSMITIVWLISIAVSSYNILYGQKIFNRIKSHKKILKLIPWKNKHYIKNNNDKHEIILFGYGRFGSELFDTLTRKSRKKIFVVDQDPNIIKDLNTDGISNLYWDVGEIDFLEEINVKETKMVISTIKNYDDNLILLKTLKKENPKIIFLMISHSTEEASSFYEEWADYVILPHHLGAHHTSMLLETLGYDVKSFIEQKEIQLLELSHNKKNKIKKILKNLI